MANEVTNTKTTAITKESANQFQQMANIGFEEVNSSKYSKNSTRKFK